MDKKPEHLLDELQSISKLLDKDQAIPILDEAILDDTSPAYKTDVVDIEDIRHYKPPTEPHAATQTIAEHEKSELKASGNNPFLPQHIRSRLSSEQAHDSLTELLTMPGNPYEKTVDEIVKRYLPKIEADLRTHLLELMESVLSNKKV